MELPNNVGCRSKKFSVIRKLCINTQYRNIGSSSVMAAMGDGLVGVWFKPTLVCIIQPNDTKQILGIVELVGFLAL